jgi:hypothetical protein
LSAVGAQSVAEHLSHDLVQRDQPQPVRWWGESGHWRRAVNGAILQQVAQEPDTALEDLLALLAADRTS